MLLSRLQRAWPKLPGEFPQASRNFQGSEHSPPLLSAMVFCNSVQQELLRFLSWPPSLHCSPPKSSPSEPAARFDPQLRHSPAPCVCQFCGFIFLKNLLFYSKPWSLQPDSCQWFLAEWAACTMRRLCPVLRWLGLMHLQTDSFQTCG